MRNNLGAIVTVMVLVAGPAAAQVAAPAAGSGGGGGVGPSVSSPNAATGATPPGTPGTATVPEQISRDTVGQSVIGHTTTPASPVPGNTGGQGTGSK